MIKLLTWLLIGPAILLVLFTNCSQEGFNSAQSSSSASSAGTSTSSNASVSGGNVIAVSVGCAYVNEPCVSVTICKPNTGNCQTIPNVLLDTGSYGLRLFSSVVALSLTNLQQSSGVNYAECVSYADGSSDWGPVKIADVMLGQERASSVPIQIIDSTFSKIPSDCTSPDTGPLNFKVQWHLRCRAF